MPSSLLFVLLIVVWAFVLAPLVVRNREPIRRTSEALGRTRLLHSGGQRVNARRRPRFTEEDVRRRSDIDADLSVETVPAELEPESLDDVLIDDAPVDDTDGVIEGELLLEIEDSEVDDKGPDDDGDNPRVIADGGGRDLTRIIDGTSEAEVVEIGSMVGDEPGLYDDGLYDDEAVFAAGYGATLATDIDPDASRVQIGALQEQYAEDVVDLSNLTTDEREELTELLGEVFDLEGEDLELSEDEILIAAGYDPAEEYPDGNPADDEAEISNELNEEDLEYAAAHRGRGGFDPEQDARYAEIRFARRRRWVRVLIALTMVALALGFWLGGWVWAAPAVAAVALVGYLLTLRRTVVVEQELRNQRIQMLKRRRLGVRTSDFDEALPDRLRRPGAIVVELDDEDPEFADLNYGVYDDEYELDRRAVG